jgi:hypothetical protein
MDPSSRRRVGERERFWSLLYLLGLCVQKCKAVLEGLRR